MSNIEQGILNIEVMNRCAPSFSMNGWPLQHSCNRYSILDIQAPFDGRLVLTRSTGGDSVMIESQLFGSWKFCHCDLFVICHLMLGY